MSAPRGRPGPGHNRLLTLLPQSSRERLEPYLTPRHFALGQTLLHQGDPITQVVFPTTAVISLVVRMEDGASVEAATAGFEGVSNVSIVLGERISQYEVTIQGEGDGLQMPAADLVRLADQDHALRDVLLRYAQVQTVQASRSAACNRVHEVEERMARWLLHMHDWLWDSRMMITHEFLAAMLGVRRSTVTVAAGALQDAGLIAYRRGEVTILDRSGLEDVACEDYNVIRAAFERLLPLPGPAGEQHLPVSHARKVAIPGHT